MEFLVLIFPFVSNWEEPFGMGNLALFVVFAIVRWCQLKYNIMKRCVFGRCEQLDLRMSDYRANGSLNHGYSGLQMEVAYTTNYSRNYKIPVFLN